MKLSLLTVFLTAAALAAAMELGEAQDSHEHGREMHRHPQKSAPRSALQPAQGASVKIIAPKEGQIFKGDLVPLEFAMSKGKRGEHIHAYVDGELMGMFKGPKGTLTGIKPGRHTLELRVGTADHRTELNAIDRVSFTTE
jgi:hypothetical protein